MVVPYIKISFCARIALLISSDLQIGKHRQMIGGIQHRLLRNRLIGKDAIFAYAYNVIQGVLKGALEGLP